MRRQYLVQFRFFCRWSLLTGFHFRHVQLYLWHFSRWYFNPWTVCFPGLLLPTLKQWLPNGKLLLLSLTNLPWRALLTAVKNYNKSLEELQDFFFKIETKTKCSRPRLHDPRPRFHFCPRGASRPRPWSRGLHHWVWLWRSYPGSLCSIDNSCGSTYSTFWLAGKSGLSYSQC